MHDSRAFAAPARTLGTVNRRRALAVASLGAALVAVWAAGSGTPGSGAASNRAVQSVVLSIAVPVVLAVSAAVAVALAIGVFSRRRPSEEEPEEEREPASRAIAILAILLAIAPMVLVVVLLLTSHHHRLVQAPALPNAVRAQRPIASGKRVHLDSGVVSATAAMLAAGAALYLFRRRIRFLLHGSRRLAELPGPHELRPLAARSRMAEVPAPAAAPAADPRDEGDPRRAIVLAYQRFVAAMSGAGFGRGESETPFEYCARLAAAPPGAHAPVREASVGLTTLFSAARYSPEAPSGGDRAAAIDCLAAIEHELARTALA